MKEKSSNKKIKVGLEGRTPLHWAARNGCSLNLKFLIDNH